MGGSFETDDRQRDQGLKPIRVPLLKQGVFEEARNLASELAGWRLLEADEQRGVLVCERRMGLFGGTARVTITIDGPEGIPSATVRARSESSGGLFSRDRSVVQEFMKPFFRRVC